MRTEMKSVSYARTLERLLERLEHELIDASDEELLEAARELRLRPEMKGSAIFLGLKYPATPRLSDFFAMDAFEAPKVEQSDPTPLRGLESDQE